ncbi:uncharacterized protein LOC116188580 [Punica granatum]|uniref:Uncharacterized protein LOC116188580 n=1 Tax=Punica granatum TaxID=22663 RepID=A0A6P8BXA8_PUNGR|nr:uncharacterized protein LOC116188580 [Punica granatum]
MSRIESRVRIEDDGHGVLVRPHRKSSSLLSFSPQLMIEGLSRTSFSYHKLPPEPIKLSVLKLDGSSFDVRVMGTATVRELKEAVESAFSHMPKKGPGKISWRHVWGHFCLCYDGQKLLTETDHIINYGIKDGDQLHVIRHISSNYTMEKKQSSKRNSSLKQRRKSASRSSSDEGVEVNYNKADEDDDGYLEKGNIKDFKKHEDSIGHRELRPARLQRGWHFQYSQLSTLEGRRAWDKDRPRRCPQAFWHKFWKIMMFFGEKACT